MLAISGILATLMALVHLFGYKIRRLQNIPRSKWLSMAGGISVAYVFIHILPELHESHVILKDALSSNIFLAYPSFLIALLGLTVFYGLERMAVASGASKKTGSQKTNSARKQPVFWVHIISFALYNFMIGYLLYRRDTQGIVPLLVFGSTMALHFLVNDIGLIDHYRQQYLRKGRYLVSLAVIGGWLLSIFIALEEIYILLLFSFLAGGIIMNVLKEELPEERKSNFLAFFAGVVFFTILLSISE